MANWHDRLYVEGQENDTYYAQEKFDSILQDLKENPEKVKERYSEDILGRSKDGIDRDKLHRSPAGLFGKGGDVKLRRNKRRAPIEEDFLMRDSVIIKVFERSVDFGQFPSSCPVYPMARAWMRNCGSAGTQPTEPHTSGWSDVPAMDEETPVGTLFDEAEPNVQINEQLPDCVYSLPMPTDCLSDNQVRIPRVGHQDEEPLSISADSSSSGLTPEVLLEGHISHWRDIRNRWKESAKQNESRYMSAYTILKEMYEKTIKDI